MEHQGGEHGPLPGADYRNLLTIVFEVKRAKDSYTHRPPASPKVLADYPNQGFIVEPGDVEHKPFSSRR